jgi:hypothetical protein
MPGDERGMPFFSRFEKVRKLVAGLFGTFTRYFAHGSPYREQYSTVQLSVKDTL